MRVHYVVLPVLLVFALVGSGCATLFTGSTDDIVFESEPPGADVIVDGLVVGQTPTTVSVKRPGLSDQQATMRLAGYDPITFTLGKEFNTIAILNLAGLVGWGVDILTGAVMKYSEDMYVVDMRRGSVTMPGAAGAGAPAAPAPPPEPVEEVSAPEPPPPPEPAPPQPLLDVRTVQGALNSLGYRCGVVDGIMGNNTHACIRAFQRDEGLPTTGEIDQRTSDRLRAVR